MEAIGRLAGGVAHDFNNLLTVITGYGEMLIDGLEADEDRRPAEQILKAAGRAASLTRQLLTFSRRQALAPQVLMLDQIVADAKKMLGALSRGLNSRSRSIRAGQRSRRSRAHDRCS